MERALRLLGSLNTEPEESTLGKDSSVHLMYSDPKLKERILLCWRISLPSSQNFRFSTLGHRSLIRNGTPTVVININAFLYKLNVLYPRQHAARLKQKYVNVVRGTYRLLRPLGSAGWSIMYTFSKLRWSFCRNMLAPRNETCCFPEIK